jgi:DNA-3-methyladenine glycosylase II
VPAVFTLTTRAPFRLDRTVAVLQRLPSNPVDVLHAGAYLRAFETSAGPVVWRVQPLRSGPRAATVHLRVSLDGPAGDLRRWRALVRRMLGLDVDLARFFAAARDIRPLAPLLPLAEGLRPPRFAALHEAFAAVVLFQQVSLVSALATFRRLVAALAAPVEAHGETLYPFPSADRLADASGPLLRRCGLSGAKARSLRAAAGAVASGALEDAALARLPSDALVERLREMPGIGPWTASLIALRYFGRLDVFPPGDVAAVKALGEVGAASLVERLGPWRGMLYYLLFVRRIANAGAPAWTHGAATGWRPAAAPGSPAR